MKVSGPWEVVLVVTVCICAFFVNNQVITPDIMESRNIIAAHRAGIRRPLDHTHHERRPASGETAVAHLAHGRG